MSAISTVNRRTFLKVTGAAGAGFILGFYIPRSRSNGYSSLQGEHDFAPNAWLEIDRDNRVTLTVAKSEMGQGVRTSLPMIIADELEADWTRISIRQAPADPEKFGDESTGGSSSVRRSWQMLRIAGATARQMLIVAAAQKWNVDSTTCYAETGAVIHKPTGRKIQYGDLVDLASSVPVPSDPPLKDSKDFRVIGNPLPRLDTPDKVQGKAIFGIDVKVPAMLYAAIVRPPSPDAKLLKFDASKAKSLDGVTDVIQIGDKIAVIAKSTWAAFQGKDALSITWNEKEYANRSSESIWKSFEDVAKSPGDVVHAAGNVEEALKRSARIVDAVYMAPFAAHATMEPMNCTASVTPDGCEVWAPTQRPQDAQSEAADELGIPTNRIKINVTLLGGGFGRRLENDYVIEAVKVAKTLGAPVKVVWSREDDMQHDFYRPATYNELHGALDSDGRPIAWSHRVVGARAKGLVVGGAVPSYSIPNILIDSHILDVGVPVGAWRSVGYSQNAFVIESFIDELAHASGKDPFEYRRSLLTDAPRLKGALELASGKSGWGSHLPPGRGRGIACVQGFGSAVAEVAEVEVKDNSFRVLRFVAAIDCGPVVNPDTVEAQLESAIAFGLTASILDEITVDKGAIKQSNFDDYEMLRMNQMPEVEVHIVPSNEALGGVGEPGVPPVAPAVANAIFAASGKRLRRLPLRLGS